MQTDPSFDPWREEAVKRGYASSVVLPIINEGKTFGALSIYSTETDPFSEEEINLLSEIADDLAYGITNLRLLGSEKKATEAIRESEEKYRQLFDSMSEGFALHEIITDDNGKPVDYRFLSINHAFEKLTGLNAGNLIGKRVSEALPGTEMYWIETYGKVALTGVDFEFENYHAGLDKYFRVNAFCPQKGYFASIFDDITERKIAQEQMRISGEKLELALENGNIGTWEWDLETYVISWDSRMELIFGIEPGSFEGTYEAFTRYLAEDDIPHVNKAVKEALDFDIPFETVYRRKREDGSIHYISAKASVVKNSKGKPVKMSGVCFDITDMKEGAEKTLFKLNEELLRSNRELEQFAYVASHDLQEPLRMVSSFTQLLSQRYADKLDKDAQEFIGFAVDGAVRMQNLINDLLEFSRIETKGRKFKELDINKAFFQASDNLKLKINEENARVTNDELPTIMADESQMVLLFQNLIGNALKFSKNQPRIHVSATEEDDCYLLFRKR
jgi:PAS domain S-box-containing protein